MFFDFRLLVSPCVYGGTFFVGGEQVGKAALTKKEAVVKEIEEKIENSTSLVLVDYRGLTVEEVTELRNQYREEDVEYKVYKNTLLRLAFNNLGIEGMDEYLTGPSAVAFSMGDSTSSAKVTDKFAKDHKDLEVKAGLIDGELLDVAGVEKLAKIPSREELLQSLVMSVKAPITNFVLTTKNMVEDPMRDLIHVAETLAERAEEE